MSAPTIRSACLASIKAAEHLGTTDHTPASTTGSLLRQCKTVQKAREHLEWVNDYLDRIEKEEGEAPALHNREHAEHVFKFMARRRT